MTRELDLPQMAKWVRAGREVIVVLGTFDTLVAALSGWWWFAVAMGVVVVLGVAISTFWLWLWREVQRADVSR